MPFGESGPTMDNGTWAYVGDDLELQTLTRGGGGPAGPVRYEYCRDGDALTLRQKGIPLPLVIQIELLID